MASCFTCIHDQGVQTDEDRKTCYICLNQGQVNGYASGYERYYPTRHEQLRLKIAGIDGLVEWFMNSGASCVFCPQRQFDCGDGDCKAILKAHWEGKEDEKML